MADPRHDRRKLWIAIADTLRDVFWYAGELTGALLIVGCLTMLPPFTLWLLLRDEDYPEWCQFWSSVLLLVGILVFIFSALRSFMALMRAGREAGSVVMRLCGWEGGLGPPPAQVPRRYYATSQGRRYHRLGCICLREKGRRISPTEIRERAMRPCQICWPHSRASEGELPEGERDEVLADSNGRDDL